LDLLIGVTGIADASTIQILVELLLLPEEWGATAKLDPLPALA